MPCVPGYREECSSGEEERCETVYESQCRTEEEQVCNVVYEEKCSSQYETPPPACSPKCSVVLHQKCNTQYEPICEKGKAGNIADWYFYCPPAFLAFLILSAELQCFPLAVRAGEGLPDCQSDPVPGGGGHQV